MRINGKKKVVIQFIQPAPLNLVAGCTKKLLNDWSIKIQTRILRTIHQVYALFFETGIGWDDPMRGVQTINQVRLSSL